MASSSKKPKTYHFHAEWEADYFLLLKKTVDKQNPPQYPSNNQEYLKIIAGLREEFDQRFQDFKSIMIVAQFVNYPSVEIHAEEFSTCVVKHFGEDQAAVEIEVVDFQNDLSLRTLSTTGNIWPLVPKEKYPNVIRVALRMKAMFSSTYLCEASFSSMKFIKNKYRNRLTDEHLDNCIRMATTTYSPNFKKILDGQKEFHSSH